MFQLIFNKNSHNCWIVLGLLAIGLISCGGKDTDTQSAADTSSVTQEQITENSAPDVSVIETSAPDTTENNEEHSSPAVSETETAPPEQTPSYPYTFTGYDYILQDTGDGWNQGSMRFAIENQSDRVLYLDTLNFQNGGIVLETLEGPTYPVNLTKGQQIRVQGPIPPGVRITALLGQPGNVQFEQILTWKSATAATPSRIIFLDYPDLVLEIPSEKEASLSFPFIGTPVSFPHLRDVQDKLIDDPQGLQVSLTGDCVWGGHFLLGVSFVNNDQFNEADIQTDLQSIQVSIFDGGTGSGRENYQTFTRSYDENGESLFGLGPGQSAPGRIAIGDGSGFEAYPLPNTIIVFWLPDGSYLMHDLGTCGQV